MSTLVIPTGFFFGYHSHCADKSCQLFPRLLPETNQIRGISCRICLDIFSRTAIGCEKKELNFPNPAFKG